MDRKLREPSGDPLFDTAMERIGELQSTKASRKTVTALIVSFVLDIGLTVALMIASVTLHSTQDSLTQTQAAITAANLSQCQQNNAARAQDKDLWDTFIGDLVPAGTNLTPKLAAEVAGLRAIVAAKDTPRNCVKIYGNAAEFKGGA